MVYAENVTTTASMSFTLCRSLIYKERYVETLTSDVLFHQLETSIVSGTRSGKTGKNLLISSVYWMEQNFFFSQEVSNAFLALKLSLRSWAGITVKKES